MVALNPDYAPVKSASRSDIARQRVDGTSQMCPKDGLKRVPGIGQIEPQNRVGDFFARNGDRVGTQRPVSRIVIRGKYDVASTMASGHSNFEYGAVTGIFSRAFNKKLTEIETIDQDTHFNERQRLNEEGIRRIFGDAAVDDPNFVFTEDMLLGDNLTGEVFNRAHPSANAFHSWGRSSQGNVKWTLNEPGKTYGSIELVIRSSGRLETRPKFMGTYNFGGDNDSHMRLDVKPYLRWGNSPSDPTSKFDRYYRLMQAAPDAVLHKFGLY